MTLALARRFVRGRRLLYSSLTIGVTTVFLTASYMTLHALSLTTRQRTEQQLGRFSASIDLGGLRPDIEPGHRTPLAQVEAAARRAGLADIDVELHSVDVQATVPGSPRVLYSERDWQPAPMPARYRLTRGRWPARPGEVAITNPRELANASVGELKLFSGRASFTVVGLADDRYGEFPQLLAAPGTWATLDPRLHGDFPTVLGTLRISSTTADEERLARIAGGTAQQVETPATLARTAEAVWFARLPTAYRIPAVLLPLLAGLLMIASNDRWLRDRLLALTDAGVPRHSAAHALMLAVLAVAAGVVAIGGAAGWLLAIAVRPVLAAAHPLPLSPPVVPLAPVATALAVVVAGWLGALATVRFGRFERREPSGRLSRRSRRWRDVRHLAALATACGAIALTAELRTASATMLLAGCAAVTVVLLTPELVGWTAARLREPTQSPSWRSGSSWPIRAAPRWWSR